MTHFDAQKNSVLLHYNLMGLRRIHNQLVASTQEYTDVSEADARELLNMVKAMPQTELGDWYDNFWRMFPFDEPTFDNLDEFEQRMVLTVANYVCSLSDYYGAPSEELQ